MLSGYNPGNYILFSPIQKENGPRLYDQYFGFQYRGSNAYISVYVTQSGQSWTQLITGIQVQSNTWNTVLRNLSASTYFQPQWNSGKEWQVRDDYLI